MNPRIERLLAFLEEPLLVTNLVNVRYLTGFESTNAALLVDHERVLLFTDFRYAEAARRVEGVESMEVARNLLASLAERLSGRIGFEADAVTYTGFETLAAGRLELLPRRGLVERLRAVKDEEELRAIREAAAIADRALEQVAGERFTGRTERDVAWRIQELFHAEGADGVAFPVVVGAGPTGAVPHARPGDRTIERGETVVVDFGARVDGYCSDCTRTFATGELPGRLREAYDAVLEAQLAGLEAVRAGATGRGADEAARGRIDSGPFAGTFGHGLGHGVGLEVHEAPVLRPESEDVLAAGNVVTVEPGIYLAGEGGIRIEDLVVVTGDGREVLSSFTKELVTVA